MNGDPHGDPHEEAVGTWHETVADHDEKIRVDERLRLAALVIAAREPYMAPLATDYATGRREAYEEMLVWLGVDAGA